MDNYLSFTVSNNVKILAMHNTYWDKMTKRRSYHVWRAVEIDYLKKMIRDSKFSVKTKDAQAEMIKKFPDYRKLYTYSSIATMLSELKARLEGRRICPVCKRPFPQS